jgi:hypothetical protein
MARASHPPTIKSARRCRPARYRHDGERRERMRTRTTPYDDDGDKLGEFGNG